MHRIAFFLIAFTLASTAHATCWEECEITVLDGACKALTGLQPVEVDPIFRVTCNSCCGFDPACEPMTIDEPSLRVDVFDKDAEEAADKEAVSGNLSPSACDDAWSWDGELLPEREYGVYVASGESAHFATATDFMGPPSDPPDHGEPGAEDTTYVSGCSLSNERTPTSASSQLWLALLGLLFVRRLATSTASF